MGAHRCGASMLFKPWTLDPVHSSPVCQSVNCRLMVQLLIAPEDAVFSAVHCAAFCKWGIPLRPSLRPKPTNTLKGLKCH